MTFDTFLQTLLLIKKTVNYVNPMWAGGRVNLTPNPIGFLRQLKKKFELWSSNFLAFLTNTCHSLKAYCLNALFYPFQNKSIFIPTSSHLISKLYSSLESLQQKQADCTIFAKKFCTDFCTDACKGNLHIFSFSWIHILVLNFFKMFLQIWIRWVKSF